MVYVSKFARMDNIHGTSGNTEIKEQPEGLEALTEVDLVPLYHSSELKVKLKVIYKEK